MQHTLPLLWLVLALGILSASCSQDATTPTDPSVLADRQSQGDGKNEGNGHDPVTYAVIGDVPYGAAALASFPTLIGTINGDPAVRRVIHIGDIKSGTTVCSDAWFNSIATDFTTFADPLVYAIGDNEWTDCHRPNNGSYNPLERLAKIRELFFANPGYTLGQQVRIKAEDNYPENQRWMASDVVFGVFHIIGSNNGRAPWFTDPTQAGETPAETAAREAEWAARDAANLRWLERTFQQAREEHAKGVVLFFQADMWHPDDRKAGLAFEAHTGFVARLAQLATAFGRPVLLVSGDSHDYRVDVGVPWFGTYYGVTPPANITQVILDRSIEDDIDYLRLKIDPKSAAVFSWEQVFVPVI
jgi:hypothetical protein